MADLDVKVDAAGAILARRRDGLPLTLEDRQEAKVLAATAPLRAVLIDSPVVGPVWFALSDDFQSDDDVPVFYASELPHLRKMSPHELRRRYEDKQALRGGRILERT